MSRSDTLMAPVPRDGLVLEIGPSISPIAAKRDGWNTKTVDHTTKEGLIEKYRGHTGIDISKIEDVDYIWTSGDISDAIPEGMLGTFDAFVASHVIEHVTDLVSFLNSADMILKPNGVVVLAIPDKRYCFDYFQMRSTTGNVLEAHNEKRSRHSRTNTFEFYSYAATHNGAIAWGQEPIKDLKLMNTLETALQVSESVSTEGEYHDLHAWRFTPAGFELILVELARLGFINLKIERITEAVGCEFYAWLRSGGGEQSGGFGFYQKMSEESFANLRLSLLKRALLEVRPQIDWLLAGEPSLVTGPLNTLPRPGSTDVLPQVVPPQVSVIEVTDSTEKTTPRYVDWMPSPLNAVKAFEGEWSSQVPGLAGTGNANLFEDGRINEFERRLGSFDNKHVLELGPLEGGHTYMMTRHGATVTAIESNLRAWMRCLVVKDALDIQNVTFLLGDFVTYLANSPAKVDFLLASGVLYHMIDPVAVLQNMCKVSDTIGLWTHYFDPAVLKVHEQKRKFDFKPQTVMTRHNRMVELYSQKYLSALEWTGFCGGSAPGSNWLRGQDILGILNDEGFNTDVFLDEPKHQNGPSFCVFAARK